MLTSLASLSPWLRPEEDEDAGRPTSCSAAHFAGFVSPLSCKLSTASRSSLRTPTPTIVAVSKTRQLLERGKKNRPHLFGRPSVSGAERCGAGGGLVLLFSFEQDQPVQVKEEGVSPAGLP